MAPGNSRAKNQGCKSATNGSEFAEETTVEKKVEKRLWCNQAAKDRAKQIEKASLLGKAAVECGSGEEPGRVRNGLRIVLFLIGLVGVASSNCLQQRNADFLVVLDDICFGVVVWVC